MRSVNYFENKLRGTGFSKITFEYINKKSEKKK